jgi:uncharacterized OB-fold protein
VEPRPHAHTTAREPGPVADAVSDEELVRLFDGQPVDHDSAAHYRGRLERRLLVNRCDDCGHWHQPPQPICPRCWSTAITATEVSGRGTVHLMVLLHQGPPAPGVDYRSPYPVVAVELDEQPGLRFTGTVVGAPLEAVAIGAGVELDWIERGGVPVPAFRITGAGR